MGAMSTVHADSSYATAIGLPVILGTGSGLIYSAAYFPILAPLPVSENAHALALFSFVKQFASVRHNHRVPVISILIHFRRSQVWGVTIGTAVLQTQLGQRLPAAFIEQFPGGVAIAYSAIPVIPTVPEPLRTEIRTAFADSIIVIWQVMIGVGGLGLLFSLLMKGLPLHTQVDENWGIEDKKSGETSSLEHSTHDEQK